MNETLFFFHILLLIFSIFCALRLGRAALLALFSVQVIISNLFVTKQILFFGFHITCSDVYVVGSLFSLNLIREYFGKNAAKRAIYVASFLLFFFTAMSQLHLTYTPSPHDQTQTVWTSILGVTPRITLASFLVAFLCQRLDICLYGFFKQKGFSKTMAFRFGGASLISQFVDTVLFSFLGLYGLVYCMTDIIIVSYLIKVFVILSMTPFTVLAKRVVRDPLYL